MKSIIATLTALATYSQAIQLSADSENPSDELRFAAWAAQQGREYKSVSERAARLQIWRAKDVAYNAINADPENTYKVALNKFADWSEEEFRAILLKDIPVSEEPASLAQVFSEGMQRKPRGCTCSTTCGNCACNDYGVGKANSVFDWRYAANNPRAMNVENPITDQLACGSCWAFADAALMEMVHYLTNPSQGMLKFSEQQILDCNPYGFGCAGGWPEDIFTGWMIPQQVHAIERLNYAAPPNDYIQGQNATCNPNSATGSAAYPVGSLSWYYATNNPQAYVNGLLNGPIQVYIEADTYTFQGYYSGVINSSCCFAGRQLNHVVVLVGWKVDAQQSAWIIRNSWGTGWGVGGYGYIKMSNTGYGVCGEQYQGFGMSMATVA